MLRSGAHSHASTLDVEHGAGLSRRDARRRCWTARFDSRCPDGRDRLRRARCAAKNVSVDVHSHGGKTGITSKAPPNDDLANAMRTGSLAVACLADVPDGPILGRNTEGVLAAVGTPEPGQLYRHHLERLAWMDEMVANHGLRRALSAADLEAAHQAGHPAIIADVEGLDFLETKLERLEEAHQRGIRHLQLVHYTPNDIGDFQTGAIMHQGLTSFGAEVIRACHRLGFVCDVAHATEDMVNQAIKVATKPLLLSHTALFGSQAMGPTPLSGRQVGADHARAIAETGGSIGIWHFFPSLDKYIDGHCCPVNKRTNPIG